LINDARGQFQANAAAPGFARKKSRCPCWRCFPEPADIANQCPRGFTRRSLRGCWKPSSTCAALLWVRWELTRLSVADAADGRRLKPVVEINPRYTMGRLTIELMRQTAQGSHGLFQLVNSAALRAQSCESFVAYARARRQQFPLRLTEDSPPRILEGALCLNDPAQAQVCLAVFQISDYARHQMLPRTANCR
jgi:hypothetical protein